MIKRAVCLVFEIKNVGLDQKSDREKKPVASVWQQEQGYRYLVGAKRIERLIVGQSFLKKWRSSRALEGA